MQLEDDVPLSNDVRRRMGQRGPSTSKGPLEEMIDVGGEHGAQTRAERRDRLADLRYLRDVPIIEGGFHHDSEIAGTDRALCSRERVDESPALRQLVDLVQHRRCRAARSRPRRKILHELRP